MKNWIYFEFIFFFHNEVIIWYIDQILSISILSLSLYLSLSPSLSLFMGNEISNTSDFLFFFIVWVNLF